jgi:hypothetical protein
VVHVFAGTTTKLYKLSGTAWTDVTQVGLPAGGPAADYAVSSTVQWEFAQYGDRVIATAFYTGTDSSPLVTVPQSFVLVGGGTDFIPLITDNTDLRAYHCAIVRDFLVLGSVEDGGVWYPGRVHWSAIDNPTSFTPSTSTQCDYQDIADAGRIQAILGGEFGIVIADNGIWRMTYQGAPTGFQFDRILPGTGTWYPWGCVRHAGVSYLISQEGFLAVSPGGEVARIGGQKVDQYFLRSVAPSVEHRVSAAVDRENKRILWAYPTPAAASGTSDRIIAYDIQTGKWGEIRQAVEVLGQFGAATYDVDNAIFTSPSGALKDADAISTSVDSEFWKGGRISVGGVDSAHKIGVFDGIGYAGAVTTGEHELAPGKRALVRSIRPLVDGAPDSTNIKGSIYSRNSQAASRAGTSPVDVNTSGVCEFRVNARYHRIGVSMNGPFTEYMGVEVDHSGDRSGGSR